ncbi:MAG: tetratricopeptide repeat protein [Candidatus Marinimicrobia bacterium]|nr:tetratricopeptide repeat protein [Candidatus Neomarinimicrobiota bacterium]
MRKLLYLIPLILIIVSGCSKTDTAEGLLNHAQSSIDEREYSKAITLLRDLIKTYPQAAETPHAQYQLGDIYMAHTKDFDQAIIEYQKVVESYPSSKVAMNAQFMVGYIYANYLNDLNAAKLEYEKFIELYSGKADEGLLQSVEFELKYLGKNINEIPELENISS